MGGAPEGGAAAGSGARPAYVGPRLGLSVGRRFERKAVGRNRMRRLLREAFRLERHALPPLDLILIPQRVERLPTLEELRRELPKMAAKAARRLAERASA